MSSPWSNERRPDPGAITQLVYLAGTLREHGEPGLALSLESIVKRGRVQLDDKPVLDGVLAQLVVLAKDAVAGYDRAEKAAEKIRGWHERSSALSADPAWTRKVYFDAGVLDLREVITSLTPQRVGAPVWLERSRGHYLHWSADCESARGDLEQANPAAHPQVRRCGKCRPEAWSSGKGYPASLQRTPFERIQGTGSHM